MSKWYRWTVIAAVLAVLGVGLRTYQVSQTTLDKLGSADLEQNLETGLTLQNVILEQPDDQGGLLWKIKAKSVVYSPDKQIADIQQLEGEFYRAGKVIYRVQGDRGEVRDQGKQLLLKGNIVATELASKLILRGNELEWQPEQDLLWVRDRIQAEHPQLRATATEAKLSQAEKRLELSAGVVAVTRAAPLLGLKSETLTWQLDKAQLLTDKPLTVEQYEADTPLTVPQYLVRDEQIVHQRIAGQQGEVQLKPAIVRIQDAVQLDLLDLPLKANSDLVVWDVTADKVTIDKPVTVEHLKQKILVTANRAQINLKTQVVDFLTNVQAIGPQNNSQLNADRAIWQLETQAIEANGNVRYRQNNPLTNLTGDRAVGNLEQRTVVVTGNDVITEIVPQ